MALRRTEGLVRHIAPGSNFWAASVNDSLTRLYEHLRDDQPMPVATCPGALPTPSLWKSSLLINTGAASAVFKDRLCVSDGSNWRALNSLGSDSFGTTFPGSSASIISGERKDPVVHPIASNPEYVRLLNESLAAIAGCCVKPLHVPIRAVSTLEPAADWPWCLCYIEQPVTGAAVSYARRLYLSDGTAWRPLDNNTTPPALESGARSSRSTLSAPSINWSASGWDSAIDGHLSALAARFQSPLPLPYRTKAQMSSFSAADWPNCMVVVTNANGYTAGSSPVDIALCFSDGTAWRRLRDSSTNPLA